MIKEDDEDEEEELSFEEFPWSFPLLLHSSLLWMMVMVRPKQKICLENMTDIQIDTLSFVGFALTIDRSYR